MGNYLIYLTPDTKKPDALGFVEWMSWETVIERLEDIVSCGIAYDYTEFRKNREVFSGFS
ncbi:MAG: hypothetical protein J6X43_07865 [Bacteroidales bacterium]|jgi:hypothetical protein|nr:hypothetical protein [Bacteroidales bacterium]